jgi:hypothetical protein
VRLDTSAVLLLVGLINHTHPVFTAKPMNLIITFDLLPEKCFVPCDIDQSVENTSGSLFSAGM